MVSCLEFDVGQNRRVSCNGGDREEEIPRVAQIVHAVSSDAIQKAGTARNAPTQRKDRGNIISRLPIHLTDSDMSDSKILSDPAARWIRTHASQLPHYRHSTLSHRERERGQTRTDLKRLILHAVLCTARGGNISPTSASLRPPTSTRGIILIVWPMENK